MFDSFLNRLSDAFSQHLMVSLYLFVSATFLVVLGIELARFKHNQTDKLVGTRLGQEEEKPKFDWTSLFSSYLSKHEETIKINLKKANVLFSVKEYMTFLSVGAVVGGLFGFAVFPFAVVWKTFFMWMPFNFTQDIFGRLLAGAVLGFVGSLAPKIWLMKLISNRRKLMEVLLQDAMLNMADALKSGHVIGDAIRIVGEEMPYPIGPEFAKAFHEMETGKTLGQALNDLKKSIDMKDFTMAVNAIEIQYEVGGKLEPLLRNMSKVIQERQELKKEIEKTISSSKMVGIVLLVAPVFFAITFALLNKEQYAAMFHNIVGIILLITAFLCYVVAASLIIWIIRNVSKEI